MKYTGMINEMREEENGEFWNWDLKDFAEKFKGNRLKRQRQTAHANLFDQEQ